MLSLPLTLRCLIVGCLLALTANAQKRQIIETSACAITDQITRTATVREQPVSINTDVLQNTTFYPIPDHAITVTNAPTSFDMITTFSWTEYDTRPAQETNPFAQSTTMQYSYTTSESATSAQVTPAANPMDAYYVMLLSFGAMAGRVNPKRQSGQQYVAANGTITNDCTTAPIYTITNGVLTAIFDQITYTYSTTAGVPYAAFVPSTTPGPITGAFAVGQAGNLIWFNSAFDGGYAAFCSSTNGTIFAVFQANAQPDGCYFVSLTLFTASSCAGLKLSTITGPTGVRTYYKPLDI